MAKQQKRKARPSWFQKQIDKGGEDFLLRKQPLDIQREAFNIIRDIARGNITTKRDFEYLFDLKILSNVRIAVYNEYVKLHVSDAAISYIFQVPNGVQTLESGYGVDPENLKKVFNNTRSLLTAYCAILTNLDTMIAFVQSPYTKSEEEYMRVFKTVEYQLARFKYII